MYPHYPYQPECHGYYDFAPYNCITLEEQRQVAGLLGEPVENPYARLPFADVYGQLPNTEYPVYEGPGALPPLGRVFPPPPNVEDLVPHRSRLEAPPEPEFQFEP